jgi:hypothetical protein
LQNFFVFFGIENVWKNERVLAKRTSNIRKQSFISTKGKLRASGAKFIVRQEY